MSDFIFTPPAIVGIPIKGSNKVFPVHRIYCVGRNYANHAIEMGHDPSKEAPFFFQKNPDNLVFDGVFPYPPKSHDVEHEIELVVALQKGGQNLTTKEAQDCVFGFAVGLDMTRRDLQAELKKAGRSWETAKAFEHSAPCSHLIEKSETKDMNEGSITLSVNGKGRQSGNLNEMIWKIPEMIAYLSQLFVLQAGDIIMTGTPAGVGPVQKGDELVGHIDGLDDLVVKVS
ncbi:MULTISPECIES: fumarylacetoacetate hydrolase family protein [Bartonella]|uniref:fumarylacetoacetate hydrolase family protein n=1 Tax=Bartonella TaxID=773 RepID=UPI0018DD392A|nr:MULTISPECIES: fumarylacetoacetate hydrolase family protein [Bartonella]MBH9995489.1 fumarylacetoacetate hydrolase family protein [Bartonella sp. P0291]MBH9996167.1 fumarylacetoacetate hydrolase family protein [Bartonella sp. M0192]MBH9998328.1 fumarylacetoacetate hydrolase family protein [Bartonella sp. M0191]MBI0009092.1 fumarylacetoacetate hydrolase family protein [Bartonella sp. M0193]MBI0009618.1 fumarylacetoacetate hydrolase family protein [Bartonella sp. M0176]